MVEEQKENWMNETQPIIKYNCQGLCSQKSCNKKHTHFTEIKIKGIDVLITFCKKHAEEYEEGKE